MPIRCTRTRLRLTLAVLFLLPVPLPSAQEPPPQPVVIRTATRVVTVDVVVQDKHGKPVGGLTRGDFLLRDNGQQREIAMFALDDSRQSANAGQTAAAGLTFTNRPVLGNARVTAFLFDELNTQLADQQLAKRDFLHYLRGLPSTERVAVFVLGDSLSLLHDFSQDEASLVAAISHHPSRASPEADVSNAAPVSSNSLTGDPTTTAQWDSFLASAEKMYTNYAELERATRTAAALETIAAHLEGIPGRKTLIWISGGFPIQLGLHGSAGGTAQSDPNKRAAGGGPRQGRPGSGQGVATSGAGQTGAASGTNSPTANSSSSSLPGMGTSFESDVERAIRALNEADVAVYPVDARGLAVAAPFQADRASYGKRNKPPKDGSPADFNFETLESLALETGGRAFHHINDLNTAIEEAAGDARMSYSIAFYPPADSLDDSYHTLQVSLQREGVTVRYRPGYMATSQAAFSPSLATALTNPVAFAGIGLTAHLEPTEGGYKMSVTVNPRNITLEPKDGKWTGLLQFLVVVGKVEQLTTVPLSFTEAVFHQIQEQGLVLGARVKTPPGTTGFSLGFRDVPSGLVGTLHVRL